MDAEQRLRMLALEGDKGALWAWQRHLRRAGGDLNDWLNTARRALDDASWTKAAQALLDRGEVWRDREQISPEKPPKLRVTLLSDGSERSAALLQSLLTIAGEEGTQPEGSGYLHLRTPRRRYQVQLRPNAARDIGGGGVIIGAYSGNDPALLAADIQTAYYLKTPFVYCALDSNYQTKELFSQFNRYQNIFHLQPGLDATLEGTARAMLAALDAHETAAPPLSTCSPKMWVSDARRRRPSEQGGFTQIAGRFEGRPFMAGDVVRAWDFGDEALHAEVLSAEITQKNVCSLLFKEINADRLRAGLRVACANDTLRLSKNFDILLTFDRQPSLRHDPLLGPIGAVSGEWEVRVQRRIIPGRAQWEALDRVTQWTQWGRLALAVGVPLVAGDGLALWRAGLRQAVGVVVGVLD